jgi:hypothetical protein
MLATRLVLLAVLARLPVVVPAQATPDVVRGHVRATDGSPLAGATVTATPLGGVARIVRTDDRGAYTISFADSDGPYTVAATMLGYARQSADVPRRAAGAARLDVDFSLTAVAQRVAPVTVRAQRQRPQRTDGLGAGPGEAGTAAASLASGLTGDLTGDLASAMATVPGLTITPSADGGLPTVSAFGLTGDQNSLTLNGMSFGAAGVPRDGLVLRVSSSTYDPGRGGFSGVQTALRLPSGSNFLTQFLHVTAEDPHLQGNPPGAAPIGARYARQILSGSWGGPIAEDKLYYNTSFQVGRRSSDLPSLVALDAASLQSLGVSGDSVSRLSNAATALGIPLSAPAVPSNRLTTTASALARVDWAPNATSRAGNTFYVIGGGSWSNADGSRASPTSFASHAGESRSWSAQLQATASRFMGPVLNESNLAIGASSNRAAPYLFVPDARVLVTSTFADGTAGSATLRAGGNANAESRQSGSWGQLRNETSWFSWNNRHQLRVTFDGRVENDAIAVNANRLGTFAYNSLDDFAANRPTSFSRTLGATEVHARQFLGAIGVGDIYRPFPALRVQYGLRAEGNAFGDAPTANPAIVTAFGRSTDRVPRSLTVAPMIGFTRTYQSWRGGSFTGGIREYVGTLSSQTVEAAARQTGLPGAAEQISCVGSAVPVPAFASYRTSIDVIPARCADGTSGTVFSQAGAPVSVFAPDYQPSRRWGVALGWNGRVARSLIGSVSANYSLNLHRPGTLDRNFNPAARFTLNGEDARPVFVSPASIVTTTGAVTASDSRVRSEFAHVNELRSDLRSDSKQIIIGLASSSNGVPEGLKFSTSYRAFYTLSFNREQARGFGGTTAGDPREVEWSPSGMPRHALQVLGSMVVPRWFKVDAFGRLTSGRSYTPMVNADINGDGVVNDRAFVFAQVPGAPKAARECLAAQVGTIAKRNSCTGPWTQSLNLAISPDAARVGLGDRGQISLVVTNVLGAVDQVLHGSRHLHNWGTTVTPDQTLLNVRGFDAATRAYRYDVNPSFGGTSASAISGRLPFVIAIDVQLRLGPDRDAQQLKGFFRARAADGAPVLDAQQIRARLDKDAQNNFEDIARRATVLKLTETQVAQLTGLGKRFAAVRDSVYTDLTTYLVALRGDYQTRAVKRKWHDSFVAIAREYVIAGPEVRSILSEEQFAALSPDVTAYFEMDEATFRRIMASANFGMLMELITGEGID